MKYRHIGKRHRIETREAERAIHDLDALDGMMLRRLARQGHRAARDRLEQLHAKAWAESTPHHSCRAEKVV